MNLPSITPPELAVELAGKQPPFVLDVREDDELAICCLPSVTHIPLGELADRLTELDPSKDTVVVCRGGVRSARAVVFLLRNGFTDVRNLEGGMNAYATLVDPTMPTY